MTRTTFAPATTCRPALRLAAIVATIGALAVGFVWSTATPLRPAAPPSAVAPRPEVAPLPIQGPRQS